MCWSAVKKLLTHLYESLCVVNCRSGDSGLPASLQNVYRTPVHGSSSSTTLPVPGSSSSRVKWHRSCSVRETPTSIGPSEFLELYRSRAHSDPRTQDRTAALAERRRKVGIHWAFSVLQLYNITLAVQYYFLWYLCFISFCDYCLDQC